MRRQEKPPALAGVRGRHTMTAGRVDLAVLSEQLSRVQQSFGGVRHRVGEGCVIVGEPRMQEPPVRLRLPQYPIQVVSTHFLKRCFAREPARPRHRISHAGVVRTGWVRGTRRQSLSEDAGLVDAIDQKATRADRGFEKSTLAGLLERAVPAENDLPRVEGCRY